jgi:caa(3)-type oxidase subunit IV
MSESEKPVSLQSYIKLCSIIFVIALCAIGGMIWASFLPHYGWPTKTAIILSIASVNAFLVAGYLMHLLSEKKLIYTVLAFTVFFVIGLFALTVWATNGFPPGTAVH